MTFSGIFLLHLSLFFVYFWYFQWFFTSTKLEIRDSAQTVLWIFPLKFGATLTRNKSATESVPVRERERPSRSSVQARHRRSVLVRCCASPCAGLNLAESHVPITLLCSPVNQQKKVINHGSGMGSSGRYERQFAHRKVTALSRHLHAWLRTWGCYVLSRGRLGTGIVSNSLGT